MLLFGLTRGRTPVCTPDSGFRSRSSSVPASLFRSALFAISLLAAAPAPAAPSSDTPLVTRKADVGHRDFRRAKEILPSIYTGMQEDFYCGCKYEGKDMNLASCGYQVRKQAARASKLEWEHIVAAWTLGHQRQCWQNGGRKACAADPAFARAEGDLVNLVPSVGEVNGDRSNLPFSVWTQRPDTIYGQCQTVVDFKLGAVQPRPEVRGRIARIYMYMHETYSLRMSRQDKQLMCAWARSMPVDQWELTRDRRIAARQGNGNRFVTDPKAVANYCA